MNKKGFTLIELLVVIAIIGILASIVLASLNSARIKSRDARRLSDIRQLQNALGLYYSDNSDNYPARLSDVGTQYIASIPKDPTTNTDYSYSAISDGSTGCPIYHLGATLEQSSNSALNSDADLTASASAVCTLSDADFDGTVANVYDVTP